MHKRILCLISAAILLLGLTACGDTEQPVVDATTTTTQAVGTTTDTSNAQTTLGSEVNSTVSTTKTTTTATTTAASDDTANDTQYAKFRKGLNNTYAKLTKEKELTIAYVGGSITAGASATSAKTESYRALTTAWFKKQFPDATITEINMGIGMAGSKLPAYYVKTELVPQKPDLIFLECAINDYIERNSTPIDQVKAQYETIIRQLRTADPTCEFVALYTTNAAVSATDEFFEQAAVQDAVAAHYGIPSIDIGNYLRDKTGMTTAANSTAFTNLWNTYFADSAHANVAGHAKYGEILIESLEKAFTAVKEAGVTAITKKTMPTAQNSGLMMNTAYIDADEIPAATGWTLTGSGRFKNLVANAEFTYTFTGTGISLFLQAASGTSFQYAVDGGTMQTVSIASGNTYHLPLPVVEGLTSGQHTITFKVPTAGTMKISAILVCK